jgi:uncharacterized protein
MNNTCFVTNCFGEKLETLIRIPDGKKRFPAILLVAGIGADLHETNNSHDEIAEKLVENGYVTVQFSFAGRGKSEGEYGMMTLDRQGKQVKDLIDWMSNQPQVDSAKIGIYAMSFGVPSVLATDLNRVSSLCFVSGAYFPRQAMERMFRLKGEFNPKGESFRKFSTGETISFPSVFWASLDNFDQIKVVRRLIQPVLYIHGDQDLKIPVLDVQKIYSATKSKQKKIKIFIGGDHGIINVDRSMRDEFLHNVIEWFKETL